MTQPEPVGVWPLLGVPEIHAGDDLAAVLVAALAGSGLALRDGDVLVVSSKVVSKALGLSRAVEASDGHSRAAAIEAETVRVVARRRTPEGDTVIVQARSGPVMAAAGVDASNTAPGQVLLLPPDPDAQARELRSRIAALAHGVVFGLVVADTAGRAWRDGVTDFALGAAGLRTLDDVRGQLDSHGAALQVTVRAVADEIAAAADLVKGKLAGIPAALVSGVGAYVTDRDGPGAAVVLRGPGQDWFRLGHVEAVRAALSAGRSEPARRPVEAPSMFAETVAVRANRALELALDGTPGEVRAAVVEDLTGVGVELSGGTAYARGRAVARLQVALWSEHLAAADLQTEVADRPALRIAVDELPDDPAQT